MREELERTKTLTDQRMVISAAAVLTISMVITIKKNFFTGLKLLILLPLAVGK